MRLPTPSTAARGRESAFRRSSSVSLCPVSTSRAVRSPSKGRTPPPARGTPAWKSVAIYVPGSRHRDGDNVDGVSLSLAGRRRLVELGIPAADSAGECQVTARHLCDGRFGRGRTAPAGASGSARLRRYGSGYGLKATANAAESLQGVSSTSGGSAFCCKPPAATAAGARRSPPSKRQVTEHEVRGPRHTPECVSGHQFDIGASFAVTSP